MKKRNYSKISNLNDLHYAQQENDIRLKHIECTLYNNILHIQKSLHIGTIFIKLCSDYLTLATQINFFRQGYLWLRTLYHKLSNNTEKETQYSSK